MPADPLMQASDSVEIVEDRNTGELVCYVNGEPTRWRVSTGDLDFILARERYDITRQDFDRLFSAQGIPPRLHDKFQIAFVDHQEAKLNL